MLLTLLACADPADPEARDSVADAPATASLNASPIQPLTAPVGLDPAVAELGGRLFTDPRLSTDGTVACASCHALDACGVDHKPTSTGVKGAVGPINAPTVYNSSLNFVQFWNGRAASLEEQAGGPLTAGAEMANDWPHILATIGDDPEYRSAFAASFPDGVTEANVRTSIATFERSLVTLDAPFDRYLRGDTAAISPQAAAGYQHFVEFGCVACHQGQGVGGNMYQKFGVMGDYFADQGHDTEADQGRYNVTHAEADRHVFKVPSLRNVACTAPYFHDGSADTLDQAVHTMARYQLGRELSDAEAADLVAFLGTLSGTPPANLPSSAREATP